MYLENMFAVGDTQCPHARALERSQYIEDLFKNI